jgi:GAF domain-containing protein
MPDEDSLAPTAPSGEGGVRTDLAAALGDLAVRMQAQAGSDELLHTIVEAAIRLLPGISWAGVAHVRGKTVLSQTPSDEVARTLNELQSELGEGPAISALSERRTIVVDDLHQDSRWPRFGPAATKLGVQCLMVFRLFVEREVLGALTIYGPSPNFFSEEQVAVGEILAQHAAVALAGAAAREQMNAAIASRDVIGQAKGVLMVRDRLTGLQAFAALAKASQDTNVKLVDVARFVIDEFERQLPAS